MRTIWSDHDQKHLRAWQSGLRFRLHSQPKHRNIVEFSGSSGIGGGPSEVSATWNIEPRGERSKVDWSAPRRPDWTRPSSPVALPFTRVCEALRRMTRDETILALRERIFPIAWSPGHISFAAGARSARSAAERGIAVEAVVADAVLLKALQREKDADLRKHAVRMLADWGPRYSAWVRLTSAQAAFGLVGAFIVVISCVAFPGPAAAVMGLLCAALFLLVIGLRFMSVWSEQPTDLPPPLPDASLPSYSVLVPLFQETEVAEQLLVALLDLDYPALGSKRTNSPIADRH